MTKAKRRTVTCKRCDCMAENAGRGLCVSCYTKGRRAGEWGAYYADTTPQAIQSRREKARATYKRWYEANKEKARKQKRLSMKRLRAKNPDKYNEQSRKAKKKERQILYDMYGDKCSICGFDDKRALSLDHVNNDGNEERKKVGERGVYKIAKSEYRPDRYRILCMNCQFVERVKHSKSNQHLGS